jgi:hypothetical protein
MDHKGLIIELSGVEGFSMLYETPIVTGYQTEDGWMKTGPMDDQRHNRPIHIYVEVIGLVDDLAPSRNWTRDSSLSEEKK